MSQKHILICGFEQHIRRLIERNLSRQGYVLTNVDSADEAVLNLVQEDFAFTIIDSAIAGGGYSLLKTIRTNEKTASIKTILVCQSSEVEELKSQEHRADQYLSISTDFDHWLRG